MNRRGLVLAIMAACKVVILSHMHADANWWVSHRGQVGMASWYGDRFHGRETASGEPFSMMQLTAAHRYLPLGTKVIVTNLATNEAVEVKINDRGPYAETWRRIIDLSRAAADTIGLLNRGIGQVEVVVSEEAFDSREAKATAVYEVQVGAFLDREQAQEMMEELQGTHSAVYIATRDGPLGSYHRVRIGPFQARRQAYDVAQALVREGYYVFLDQVPASSLLHHRLQMTQDRGAREKTPPEPAVDSVKHADVREGIAYYMHSFD